MSEQTFIKCDLCDRPAMQLAGESNELLVCGQHGTARRDPGGVTLTEAEREALVTAVLGKICNVSNLPDWMRVEALGRNMRPLALLMVAAVERIVADHLRAAEAERDMALDMHRVQWERANRIEADLAAREALRERVEALAEEYGPTTYFGSRVRALLDAEADA